jgi:hypothetical protein
MVTRRHFLRAGAAALAAGVGTGLYAWRVEPYWPQLVRRAMPLPDLPPALVGRTLLQLSDLHVGPLVDPAYLIETLREAAALRPDYVALTGDLVTYRTAREYDELARVLAHLPHGRSGTVGTLGNHDYGLGWRELDVADRVTAVARDAGVDVLRNATREVGGLPFVGVGDLWSPEFDPGATPSRGGRPWCSATTPTRRTCRCGTACVGGCWPGTRTAGSVDRPSCRRRSFRCAIASTPPARSTSAAGARSTSTVGSASPCRSASTCAPS